MLASWARFLLPPSHSSYERTQQARLLHGMLVAVLICAFWFAAQNVLDNDQRTAFAFGLLTLACLAALVLNFLLHYRTAAAITCVATLLVLDYSLGVGGSNLHDSGIVGFPIFILGTAFLFGRRGLLAGTLLCILSVCLLYELEGNGIWHSVYPSGPGRVLGLSILFVGMAIVTLSVREAWESNLKRLSESYDLTLHGWAKALEYRDGETEGHSRRVADLTVALARSLGCSEEEIVHIRRGAYLHDIGKMAVPDRILLKPGPLNSEEREVIEKHPELARDLISGIAFLKPALAIPYSHHENWDGSGYPCGLKGEQIPLSARLFAVVDRWDALTSDRPYRKAWNREAAFAHLETNAGILFDPVIVGAFLKMIKR